MAEQKIEPSLSLGDLVVVLSRGGIIYKGPGDDIDPDQIASMVMTGSFEPVYNWGIRIYFSHSQMKFKQQQTKDIEWPAP